MLLNRRHFLSSTFAIGSASAVRAAGFVQPRLLVVILAGQFRPEYLEQRGWSFSNNGFRRLFRDGAFYPDCRLNSSSFNASSVTTLVTGTYPSLHGIIGERWFDGGRRRPADVRGSLLSGTLSHEFRASDARNRVYSIASDAAIAELLSAGAATTSFSVDESGRYRAAAEAPGWLESFRQSYDPQTSRDSRWSAISAAKDAPPMRILTFDPAKPGEFLALYRSSPLGQAAQFGLLRELIAQEKLGRREGRDMIMIHLDALSELGRETGADSPLIGELVTHLDRQLASLFELLDARAGASNYQLVFAGAHGVADRPAIYAARSGAEVAAAVNRAVGKEAVDAYVYPFLYLRPVDPDMRKVRLIAARALLAQGMISAYLTLDGDCSHTGDWKLRMQNSFHIGRSGDVMVSYAPHVFERVGQSQTISYGSLYNYDIDVPVIFYGPGFRPGLYSQTVESIDIAPTIARATGLALPSMSTGRVLYDALSPARYI